MALIVCTILWACAYASGKFSSDFQRHRKFKKQPIIYSEQDCAVAVALAYCLSLLRISTAYTDLISAEPPSLGETGGRKPRGEGSLQMEE